jgi:hypothetical protein
LKTAGNSPGSFEGAAEEARGESKGTESETLECEVV